jgi:hypothetical protein
MIVGSGLPGACGACRMDMQVAEQPAEGGVLVFGQALAGDS